MDLSITFFRAEKVERNEMKLYGDIFGGRIDRRGA